MRIASSVLILAVSILTTACSRREKPDVDALVRDAAAIVVLTREGNAGKHRLAEVLKDDGSYPLRFKVGDAVRMSLSEQSTGVETIIAIVGRGSYGSELVPQQEYTEMTVQGGTIRALNDISLDQLRILAKEGPNSETSVSQQPTQKSG